MQRWDITNYGGKLELIDFGYKPQSDTHGIAPTVRNCNIIHYCISGKGTFVLNNKTYNIKAGQSFFIPQGAVASYYPDLSDPWEYCWVDFKSAGETVLNTTAFSEKTPVTPPIKQVKPLFYTVIKSNRELGIGYFNGLLNSLICLYSNYFGGKAENPEREVLAFAKQYIFSNYHKPCLTVGGVADYCGVSRATLFRCFKTAEKLSPQQYINKIRLENAVELLLKTDYSVKIISASVGYENQLYFSKFFKLKYGVSPSGYRSRNKKE